MMEALQETISKPVATKVAAPGSARLMSLDVFRGATIASMMLVNNPGSWGAVYQQLDHAEWNGWTFTDLIFPFFLWIVGVAVPLSTQKRLEAGACRSNLWLHAVRRAAILFGLGLFLAFFSFLINGSYGQLGGFGPWLSEVCGTIRIPGVLQRIAVCYLIATTIYLTTKLRGQIIWLIGLLAGYWILMKCIPVPGHGAGVLTPEGSFSAYVDGMVLGKHTWHGAPWDPEGVISTIPAIATCLFGILTGQLLLVKRSVEQKTGWLFVAGNLLMFAGAVMNIWLPINKNLWTSSYSVFMAGMAMNVFAVFYWLVDVKGYQKWAKPFAIYGMNAITVFMLAGLLGRIALEKKVTDAAGKAVPLKSYLFETFFNGPLSHIGFSPKICSLSWALVYVFGLYLVAYIMYRRKWFVKF
jgi:predicted acyltransferase